MNDCEHLTEKQLEGYAAGSLETDESNDVGRHLLQCADCRKRLPDPTPEQFLDALFGEPETDEGLPPEKLSFSALLPFSLLLPFFRHPQILVWSAGALMCILSFPLLNRIRAARQLNLQVIIARLKPKEN